jgi:cell division protein FtsL
MNAAARLFNQGALSRGWVVSVVLTRFQFSLFAVLFLVLVSALSLVYVTNTARSLNAGLEQTLTERSQLHIQRDQLLLEKSTLTMQAHIQSVAENHLNMILPEGKAVVVVDEK